MLTTVVLLFHHPAPASAVPFRGLILTGKAFGLSTGNMGVWLLLQLLWRRLAVTGSCIMTCVPISVHHAAKAHLAGEASASNESKANDDAILPASTFPTHPTDAD
jgi:hypothetical protein